MILLASTSLQTQTLPLQQFAHSGHSFPYLSSVAALWLLIMFYANMTILKPQSEAD